MSTPPNQQAPSSPENPYQVWRERLRRLELPVLESNRRAVLDKLNSPSANARNLAALLDADAALVLGSMALANHQLKNTDNRCQSLEHAISVLGMPRLQALVEHMPSTNRRAAWYPGLRRAVSISRHAAWQLRSWVAESSHWDTNTLYLETLLAGAPLWMLWYRGGAAMPSLLKARAQGQVGIAAQRQVFGCALQPLLASLAQAWQLPAHSQQAWQRAYSGSNRQWLAMQCNPNDPAFNDLRKRPSLLIALANALAEAADWDWDSRQTRKLLAITAAALGRDVDDFTQHVHREAAAYSRQADTPVPTPAANLLGHYRRAAEFASAPASTNKIRQAPTQPESQPPAKPQPKTTSKTTTVAATPPATGPAKADSAAIPPALTQAIARLRAPNQFDTPYGVLSFVVEAANQVLHFNRVVALIAQPGERRVRALVHTGCEQSPELAQYQGRYLAGDLFGQLLHKAAGLQVTSSNRARFWSLLPGDFKLASQAPELVLMSLFRGDQPLALIYADRKSSAGNISATDYAGFKRLCTAASHCLGQFKRS